MSNICMYAIVRFAPYSETGEFANIGIILCLPENNYFDFKLAPARFKRVSQFFDDLDNKIYAAVKDNLENEYNRLKDFACGLNYQKLPETFKEVARSRETTVRYGQIKTALVEDPKVFINQLYDKYIGRDFITKEYRENFMVKEIRRKLKRKGMPSYTESKVSNELIEATFPLTNKDNGIRIIKPMSFQQQTTTKIIEHGELWHWKIKRLINTDTLCHDKVIMPFERPRDQDSCLQKAFNEVVESFKSIKVRVTDYNDTKSIINFATEDLDNNFSLQN